MADVSPQSYQTTMPEYPDVSYTSYMKGLPVTTQLGADLFNFFTGSPNYQTWRQNKLDEYNAQESAYNAWASSPLGRRTQNEQAGYNSSYQSGATSQGSPLSYQDVNPGNGFAEMAQGIAGIVRFSQAMQGMKLASAQIAGQVAKNKLVEQQALSQAIQNKWLDQKLNFQTYGLGYSADWRRMQNEAEIQARYAGTGKGAPWDLNGVYAPYLGEGRLEYFMNGVNKGFLYNRQNADLAFLRAGTQIRYQQKQLMNLDEKAKKFYVNTWQNLQKKYLEGQIQYLNGQVKWQPIEQELRQKAVNWGIGLQATNTVLNAIKTGLSFLPSITSGASSAGTFPGAWNSGNTWTPGVDIGTGDIYGSYGL